MELNLVCYNAVLTAWARSQDGGRQAEALLRRMPMAPDAISWSAVFTAWASSARQPQGIQRAEALLRKAYGSGHSVDQSCFNTLLHAYGRQGQVDRAEHMLKQWVETVVTGVSSSKLVPDRFSFNIVLNAIAKSGRDDAGRQAQTLYEEMLEIGVAPDIITFNSLMNAWAQRENQNVLRPFFRTEDCETAPPPTMAAYAVTLTVWANSNDPGNWRRAWQVLERMRSETEQF